jgi:hypothetical protein
MQFPMLYPHMAQKQKSDEYQHDQGTRHRLSTSPRCLLLLLDLFINLLQLRKGVEPLGSSLR